MWVVEHGGQIDRNVCNDAAKLGHLETLKWAHANGSIIDCKTCARAAGGGHLEVVKWLKRREWIKNPASYFEPSMCEFLAAGTAGHFGILEWMYSGIPGAQEFLRCGPSAFAGTDRFIID